MASRRGEPSEPYILVRDVTYRYPGPPGGEPVLALDRVGFRVYRGEFVAVLGRNGSGKSTLARLLNALLLPQEGEVRVDGLDTRDPANLWAIRDRVGMVFQNPDNQIVAAVVEEDVAFGPENQGLPPEEIRRRVEEALAAVGLTALRDRPPHLLSGGQKQRLAIAGALALRPACLVLDEPTAMLDPRGRAEVMATVTRLREEAGVAVVLITHFMDEAARADRVVVMDRGRVVLEGSPREIFAQADRLRALHLDLPPVVALAAELRAAGVPVPPGILTLDELVEALCRLS
nr:MAG: energy-coupling factor transporter ATPase [Bacillota bacterium]